MGIINNQLFINPTSSLLSSHVYAVQIASTAIDDTEGNSFAGITNQTTINFTTANPYPNVTIAATGGNSVVTPFEAPSVGSAGISAYSDTNFKGEFSVNQVTGVVHITNAHPAGTYSVTVGTENPFILTVEDNNCSQGNFISVATSGLSIGVDPKIGDFNNDGFQDIVSGTTTSQFSVVLGNGIGDFGTAINTTTTRTSISDLVIGDFNGDGNQDVATTHYSSGKAAVFLGNGDGTFTNGQQSINVGVGPQSISVGDFNEDGKQDIAVANQNYGNGGSVSILIGDGLGVFTETTSVVAGLNSKDVVIGDFNEDGHQDLATTNPGDNTVSINLGNGDGTFGLKTNISVGTNPVGIAIGDFNNDEIQDFTTTNYVDNTVSIVLGQGSGTFATAISVTVGTDPWYVTIGDFNGDGNQDIVSANRTTNNISVRLGDGQGGFSGTSELAVGNAPQSLAIGDLNQDGLQDIIAINYILFGASADINLQGNSESIIAGTTTASTTNDTDFGETSDYTSTTKTYTIQNTAITPLTVNSIVISGTDATDFVVGGITLPATLVAETNSTFTVTLTSASLGEKTATVTIYNDDCDEGGYTFVVKSLVNESITLGTDDVTISNKIKLYPIPSSGILNIQLDISITIETIGIYNINGKLIKSYTSEKSLDISSLSNGIYFTKIITNEGICIKRIIKK